jgi:CspA family cold shock protein
MSTGTVRWFSNDKGYGFITSTRWRQDVFVHHTAIRGRGHKSLAEGCEGRVRVEQGRKRPQACNVHAAGSVWKRELLVLDEGSDSDRHVARRLAGRGGACTCPFETG